MNYSIRILIISAISFCFYNCTSNHSRPPEFVDGGKAVDSLKKAYNCESVEYENWEDDDANDSSLTVCFISSNKVLIGNVDETSDRLQDIARVIKKAVASSGNYKSYYVIFVKRDTTNGIISSSHTAGADMPSKAL